MWAPKGLTVNGARLKGKEWLAGSPDHLVEFAWSPMHARELAIPQALAYCYLKCWQGFHNYWQPDVVAHLKRPRRELSVFR